MSVPVSAMLGEFVHDRGSAPDTGWFILGVDGYFDVDNACWCEFQEGDAPWTSQWFDLYGTLPSLLAFPAGLRTRRPGGEAVNSMRLMGPQKRAQELKQAANRLHWELTNAVSDPRASGLLGPTGVENSLSELAEAMAIIAAITEILDQRYPAGSRQREQFAVHLDFFRRYHQVPR